MPEVIELSIQSERHQILVADATAPADVEVQTAGEVEESSRCVRVYFTHESGPTLGIALQATDEIITASSVVVQTAFDDAAASLALGFSADAGAILPTGAYPYEANEYRCGATFEEPGSPRGIILTVSPGASSTGSGYVLLKLTRL